jgi:hypothetical protein
LRYADWDSANAATRSPEVGGCEITRKRTGSSELFRNGWRTPRNGKVLHDCQENALTIVSIMAWMDQDEEQLLGLAVEVTSRRRRVACMPQLRCGPTVAGNAIRHSYLPQP